MKKLILLLLISNFAFSQNPITVPNSKVNIGVNYNFQNLSGIYNTSLFNTNFENLTTAQMNAITTPKIGREVYNTTTNSKWYYNGIAWVDTANNWFLKGNAGTTAGTNFLGTTDDQPLVVKTNSSNTAVFVNDIGNFTPSIIVGNDANLNLYLTNPLAKSFINGTSSGYVSLNQNNQILTVRNASGAVGYRLNRAGGNFDAVAGAGSGWDMGDISWWTYTSNTVNATTTLKSARLNVTTNGSHISGTNNAVRFGFEIARSGWGASTEVMRFLGDNAGVGQAATPVSTWDITKWTSANALPATTGTAQSAGHISRLTSNGNNTTIDIGTDATQAWIKAVDKTNLATNRNLLLNPNGGNVGIGTITTPLAGFHTNSTLRFQGLGTNFANTNILSTDILGNVTTRTIASIGTAIRMPISSLNAAVITNTIDNGLWAQRWNWNTLATGTALTLGTSSMTSGNLLSLSNTNPASTGNTLLVTHNARAGQAIRVDTNITTGTGMNITNNAMTTGTALNINTTNANLNSTLGFFRVVNASTPVTPTGLFARIQPNNTAGSGLTMLNNGRVGIGTLTPNCELQLGQSASNRKIVLFEGANNDHQFYGFGINTSTLRYQVDNIGADHIWYAATSATTSNELMRIKGNGRLGIGTTNPLTTLDINGSLSLKTVRVATAGYTTLITDHTIHLVAGASGTFTIPSAITSTGRVISFANDSGTGVNTSIAYRQTSGVTTTNINGNQRVTIQSDGTEWFQINQ